MAKKVVRYKLVRHKWPDEIEAEKKKKRKRIITVAACILFFVGGFLSSSIWNTTTSVASNEDFSQFFDIYNTLNHKFYFGKDKENFKKELINGAINGMISVGGDRHTMYLDNDQSQKFTSSMEGSFVGIGISFYSIDENTFVISQVYKGSPAEEVGLLAGDQLYAVDGKVLKGMSMDDVADLVKGKEGTSFTLEIVRENKHMKKTIERRTVQSSVYSEIKGDVAVLNISSFAETTGTELGVHLADIKKAGCKSLIVDMRDNSGGYLVAAQQAGSYLLGENQVIFKEEDKNGNIVEYKTYKDIEHYKFDKLIVVVNQDTASAAEVLTAALKEQANATVVGVNTYGKGTVQQPIPFSDGSMFKYTVSEWLTPKGEKINGIGIQPDVEVKLDDAFLIGAPKLEDKEVFQPDTVNIAAKSVQTYLKFLGYPVSRTDEYFSPQSGEALKQYQKDVGLNVDGVITNKVITSLISSVSAKRDTNREAYDTQMKKAMELANE